MTKSQKAQEAKDKRSIKFFEKWHPQLKGNLKEASRKYWFVEKKFLKGYYKIGIGPNAIICETKFGKKYQIETTTKYGELKVYWLNFWTLLDGVWFENSYFFKPYNMKQKEMVNEMSLIEVPNLNNDSNFVKIAK